jgi:hypothetical protein
VSGYPEAHEESGNVPELEWTRAPEGGKEAVYRWYLDGYGNGKKTWAQETPLMGVGRLQGSMDRTCLSGEGYAAERGSNRL